MKLIKIALFLILLSFVNSVVAQSNTFVVACKRDMQYRVQIELYDGRYENIDWEDAYDNVMIGYLIFFKDATFLQINGIDAAVFETMWNFEYKGVDKKRFSEVPHGKEYDWGGYEGLTIHVAFDDNGETFIIEGFNENNKLFSSAKKIGKTSTLDEALLVFASEISKVPNIYKYMKIPKGGGKPYQNIKISSEFEKWIRSLLTSNTPNTASAEVEEDKIKTESSSLSYCYTNVKKEFKSYISCIDNSKYGEQQVYSVKCGNGNKKQFYYVPADGSGLCMDSKGYYEYVRLDTDGYLGKDKEEALKKLCGCTHE